MAHGGEKRKRALGEAERRLRFIRKQKRPRNSLDRFVHDSCKIRQASSVRYFLAFFFAFFAFFAPFFAAFFLATVILLTEPNL